MSTRGAIARNTTPGTKPWKFKGVYHHWDSYPAGLGETLYHMYRGEFNRDIKKMLEYLIDEHPAGWSTVNGERKAFEDREWEVTEKNASASGVEWAYVFDDDATMHILASYYDPDSEFAGQKMIGKFGQGDPKGVWNEIARINLNDDSEPDWEGIHKQTKGGN